MKKCYKRLAVQCDEPEDYRRVSAQVFVINVKNDVYKNGYRRRSYTSITAKIHRFVRFVMYCLITPVPVAFWSEAKQNEHPFNAQRRDSE